MRFGVMRIITLGMATLVAVVSSTTTTGAQGTVGGLVIGSGTISPGLTASFQPQYVSFSGDIVAAGVSNSPQVYIATPCSFNGSSTFGPWGSGDNIALGEDVISGACGNVTATLNYLRVGSVVSVSGTGSFNGLPGTIIGACVWVTTGTPPVMFYSTVCVWVGVAP